MEVSRRCVPYTPMWKKLNQMNIALVTTGGVRLKTDEPYNDEGDERFYVLPADVKTEDLTANYAPAAGYDITDTLEDINVMFPIDRLRELKEAGIIGGIAKKHIVTMGYTMKLKKVYEETVPAIAKELERSNTDGVILTAGWPHVCHRAVVAIQRAIELSGIPTVLVTLSPEESAQMRPPRAFYPSPFQIGNAFGHPHQVDLQRKVLETALNYFNKLVMPGQITDIEFPEY